MASNKTVPYCKLVVGRPKLCFGLALAAHFSVIMLTAILYATGFHIIPADFSQVPLNLEQDDSKLRADAWNFVDQDPQIDLNAASLGVQGERATKYDMLQLIYERKNGNVFTKENLKMIQKTERELFANEVFRQKLCLKTQKNQCKQPTSIIRFFDGSYQKLHPLLNDTEFDNIPRVLSAAKSRNHTRAILDYHLGKDAVINSKTATSSYTRTFLSLGFPFKGFQSTADRPDDQWDFAQKHSGEAFAERLDDLYESGVGEMNFYYSLRSLFFDAVSKQVIFDLLLVFGSLAFIFFFMLFQTRSLWITGWGLFSIFSSFLGANLIYRIVLDFRYIGVFHVLSVFIILGIGADDVFVFCDTWRTSRDEVYPNLVCRFSHVYSHAAGAMFITSFTTMVAFISNVFSPLLSVSSFGTFSALLVFVNYCSVIIFFPTVVITHELYWKDWKWPCCKLFYIFCDRNPRDNRISPTLTGDMLQEKSSSRKSVLSRHTPLVARLFGGVFFDKVVGHKVTRWIILVVFTAFICLSITYATRIAVDEEEVDIWGKGTNWYSVKRLTSTAFKPSSEDNVINLYIVWGLKNQDRSECHFTDFNCKGNTVLDRSFDLNHPPCQLAMLDFCKELKRLSADKRELLKIRRNAVTGEPDIRCFLQDMSTFLKDEAKKSKYPNGTDFSFPLNSKKMRTLMQFNPELYNTSSLSQAYYRFFEVALGYWLTRGNTSYNNDDFVTYGLLLGGQVDPTSKLKTPSFQGGKYGNHLLYAGIKVHTTMNMGSLGYKKGLVTHDAWEEFVNQKMSAMPAPCNNAFQTTPEATLAWHWIKVQQVLVRSAVIGIITGLCLTLPLLIIMTTNWIVALLCCMTISFITVGVVGIIPLVGWKLGILESLNLTLVVGLAVDYVVHLADGYVRSQKYSRGDKVRETLGHVGISVLSGACTTVGASIFMLFARILFFFQFGIFMFCTIGLSIFYALFFFTTVLALVGPEGNTGSILPLVRYARDKLRNKKPTDVTCQQCDGRGFHAQSPRENNTVSPVDISWKPCYVLENVNIH